MTDDELIKKLARIKDHIPSAAVTFRITQKLANLWAILNNNYYDYVVHFKKKGIAENWGITELDHRGGTGTE